MSFTVADVLLDVRELIQDTLAPLRYSDEFIIRKINQVIRRMVIMRPDLFTEIANITCVAGSMQSAPDNATRLMDVTTNSAGAAIKEVNQEVLDMMFPAWESGAGGPAINWMRYPRDQRRFFLYPAPRGGEVIQIVYAKCPTMLTASQTVPLGDAYLPVLIDGTAWLMESIDTEHVESARAKMFNDSFREMLSAGLSARRITDTDEAALPKDEVV